MRIPTCASTPRICGKNRMQETCPCGSVRGALGNWRPYRDSKYGSKRCLGRTETDRKIMSEPWSSKQRSKKGRGRPLFGVNAVVCSKKKNVTKNARKKTKKDLTGPTLLEISEYANQDIEFDSGKCADKPCYLVANYSDEYQ
jgi:hypothetical protein